jgi:hypothetical protein
VSLGILNACQPLQEVIRQLENGSTAARSCRQPRDELERQYASRVANRGMKLCLLREPLLPQLGSFTCVQAPVSTGANIVCFRPADLSDVETYKANYGERQAGIEQRYLNASAACPNSTGDAARVPSTMLPMVLAEVAALELGFAVNLRPSAKGEALIVHGYARTDPELRGNIPSALEFVSFTTGATSMAEKAETKQVGDWTLRIEDDAAMAQELNEMARKQHLPLQVTVGTFSFEKSRGDRKGGDKESLLREAGRALLRYFREEGFKRISAAMLEAQTGLSKPAFFETAMKNRPYGMRKKFRLNGDFDMLFHDRAPACDPPGSGAIGVNVLQMNAQDGVSSDYGSLGVMLFAVGNCARLKSVDHYLKNLLKGVGEAVDENLSGR